MARSIDQRTKVDNRHVVVDNELLEANVLEPDDQVLDNASDDVDVIVVDLVDVVGLIVDVRAMSIVIAMVSLRSSIVVVVVVVLSIVAVIVGIVVVSWKMLVFVDCSVVRRCKGSRQRC